MPRCEQGHPNGPVLVCEKCGAPVPYADALQSLAELPKPDINYEEVALIFVGFPPFLKDGVYSAQVNFGPKEERSPSRFTVKEIGGGTWLDYCRAYGNRIDSWLKLTGFYHSPIKMLIMHTTDPTSVLLLNSLRSTDGVTVFAVVADEASTPANQNTSYVACELMNRKGVSTILASDTFASEMTSFIETKGLLTGSDAVQQLVSYLVDSITPLQDFLHKDFRLGIRNHFFSVVMGASDFVFNSPRDAFTVLGSQMSTKGGVSEPLSAYLISRAGEERNEEIAAAFARYSRGLGNLLTTGISLNPKDTRLGLYDLFLLYGVNDSRIQNSIEKGYLTVKRNAKDLGVEQLEALV